MKKWVIKNALIEFIYNLARTAGVMPNKVFIIHPDWESKIRWSFQDFQLGEGIAGVSRMGDFVFRLPRQKRYYLSSDLLYAIIHEIAHLWQFQKESKFGHEGLSVIVSMIYTRLGLEEEDRWHKADIKYCTNMARKEAEEEAEEEAK